MGNEEVFDFIIGFSCEELYIWHIVLQFDLLHENIFQLICFFSSPSLVESYEMKKRSPF